MPLRPRALSRQAPCAPDRALGERDLPAGDIALALDRRDGLFERRAQLLLTDTVARRAGANQPELAVDLFYLALELGDLHAQTAFALRGRKRRQRCALADMIADADAQASLTPDLSAERRARDRAAGARSEATEQERQAELLRTAAEIAQVYVQRAALTRRLALVDRGITQSAELERVVGLRVREGASSRVELGLQAVRAGRLRAERSRLAGATEQSRIALALLVGAGSPGFTVTAADLTALTPPEPAISSPAMLVLARADLRAAEARLQAAGGDVSAARRSPLRPMTCSRKPSIAALDIRRAIFWSASSLPPAPGSGMRNPS